MKTKLLTFCVITCLLASQVRLHSEPEPDLEPQAAWVAACFLVGAGILAGVGIYLVVKSCKPKYWCIKDRDGNHFVSTATKNEVAINDWSIVSGPYESVTQGTNNCPPPQPLPIIAFSQPLDWTIRVQESPDLINWTTIYETRDDPQNLNFTIYPTNLSAARMFYRATATP